ncbi:MAG: restriction endonuclease [Terracidiphilus sp.]
MDSAYHYPPELLTLLVDAIPRLNRSKRDVLLFFRGAGVDDSVLLDLEQRVQQDKENITKFEIARLVLQRLNEKGDVALRERREIIKRITEFEDFSGCWPGDEMAAKGYVGEIRRIVQVKDSFTRMKHERDAEREKRFEDQRIKQQEAETRRTEMESIRKELFALFADANAQRRGKALEGVLNRLFKANGILVSEAFSLKSATGDGVVEQIDGVVQLEGNHYLVEMKWLNSPVGVPELTQHLSRLFLRGDVRGLFFSASGYSAPALQTAREALSQKTIVLCELKEIVQLLEKEQELKPFLQKKVNAAVLHKNPFYEPLQGNM